MTSRLLPCPLDFAHAFGGPLGEAQFRTEPEDFVVDEILGFEPGGSGEHLLLHLRKRNQNTRWVVEQLADLAGLRPVNLGYCGLKDRRAVTSQWFSLHLPNSDLQLAQVEQIEGVELLAASRHKRKLRPGEHRSNHFRIRLRDCSASPEHLQQRLAVIAEQGVPNYFGEQRFGHNGNNLQEFQRLFVGQSGDVRASHRQRGRQRRDGRQNSGKGTGIYLSAGRSYVFNQLLSQRVEQGTWQTCLTGEDSPQAALWGRGRSQSPEQVQALEQLVLQSLPGWCDALEHSGLQQERRALQLVPEKLQWSFSGTDLELEFTLPPGTYATTILRELTALTTALPSRDIVPPFGVLHPD